MGPWQVSFREPGAATDVEVAAFDTLVDWTTRSENDIKYFSGTATYRATVTLNGAGTKVVLDLGEVKNIAEVTVNGRAYPALWKPPFRLDVTDAVATQSSNSPTLQPFNSSTVQLSLSIRVTNYWPNRLIGDDRRCGMDAQYHDDKGYPPLTIKEWPAWLTAGKPSPTGRHAFATCRLWTKDDALLPSGLIGPVKLLVER